MKNAREVLALHLWGLESDGDEIPEPSDVKTISAQEGGVSFMVEPFMPPVPKKQNSRFVIKPFNPQLAEYRSRKKERELLTSPPKWPEAIPTHQIENGVKRYLSRTSF